MNLTRLAGEELRAVPDQRTVPSPRITRPRSPKLTYGYVRQGKIPARAGTSPKLCRKCDMWFAARKRQQVCDGCTPAFRRTKRAAQAHHTRAPGSCGKTAGERGGRDHVRNPVPADSRVVYSEVLNLTFACPKSDPRYASLEARVLAYEAAAMTRNR